ncbi:MAG: WG repeat-containing protein [Thermodesulfobacteriota bacterium]
MIERIAVFTGVVLMVFSFFIAQSTSGGEKERALFPIEKDGKWGYILKTGSIAVEPRFDDMWQFTNGLAHVEVGGKIDYIDKRGGYVWKPR